jgi:hypothetical protein
MAATSTCIHVTGTTATPNSATCEECGSGTALRAAPSAATSVAASRSSPTTRRTSKLPATR